MVRSRYWNAGESPNLGYIRIYVMEKGEIWAYVVPESGFVVETSR
jgi:hypothetical protein